MEKERKDLKELQSHYQTQAFYLVFEILFIFGVPALVAFFGGQKLDEVFNTGRTLLFISLAVAFVISWAVVIVKSLRIHRGFADIERRMKEEKEDEKLKR